MIDQSKEEVAEAMKHDPETWADLFMQMQTQLWLYEVTLAKLKNLCGADQPGRAVH